MFEIMGVISMMEINDLQKGRECLIKYIHEDIKAL